MKLAHACAAAAVLLASGLVAFAGCGSATKSTNDGGPACEPACLDAPGEAAPPTDAPLHDVIDEPDGGVSCLSVCHRLVAFHPEGSAGCPDPGCEAACSRQELACTTVAGVMAFQALLDCEMGAHYACSASSPPLPMTQDCNSEAAKVASACAAPEGGAPDAGCTMTSSESECTGCCQAMHPEGAMTYGVALTHCACNSPGVCAYPCASTDCSGAVPPSGSACDKCLAASIGPDGGCAVPLGEACGRDPDCLAYESCLTTNGCAKKK